jgi:hypothetical protein
MPLLCFILFYIQMLTFSFILFYVQKLENTEPPPWIFTKKECIEADNCMHKIIGKCTYEERPLHVMRRGKASNSHDTIFWAMTYARWCFRKKGSQVYIENICEVLDIISMLNATRLNIQYITEVIKPKLIKALVRRVGLLPPSECMLTLHELLHICDQVVEVGVPRVSSLYKFERMNHVLKSVLHNAAKGNVFCFILFYSILCTLQFIRYYSILNYFMYVYFIVTGLPSIMKNFLDHERSEMEMTLSISMIDKLNSMGNFQPSNCPCKHLDSLLRPIFCDTEPNGPDGDNEDVFPILYEIAGSAVMELHGSSQTHVMSLQNFNLLLVEAAKDLLHDDEDEEERDCALHLLYKMYVRFQREHPRTFVKDFSGFILQT